MAFCLHYADTDRCCQRCRARGWDNKTWCCWVYLIDDPQIIGVGSYTANLKTNNKPTTNTYPGYRADLRNNEEPVMDKDEIKTLAIRLAAGTDDWGNPMGISARELSQIADCSKEWARKILNALAARGKLRARHFGRGKLTLFYKKEASQ